MHIGTVIFRICREVAGLQERCDQVEARKYALRCEYICKLKHKPWHIETHAVLVFQFHMSHFSDLLGCQTHYLLNGWLCTPIVQVSTGSDAEMPQDVMAINTAEKQCCVLGELSEQANITTDLDQMLGSVIDLG